MSLLAVILAAMFLVTLVIAVVALVLVLQLGSARRGSGEDAVPEDVLGLRQEVAALRAESASALRHLAVVRYDAFADMGGQLSWSVALLDDAGDGVVLTSIHGRSDARTYAKAVAGWACAHQASPQEQEAIEQARP